MTTSPVTTITDEQIAEIEAIANKTHESTAGLSAYASATNPSKLLALISRLRAAERDAGRLSYACQGFDGFFHVAKDKYEFALECAEECGREEPNAEDELNGIRRLIDTAMKGDR